MPYFHSTIKRKKMYLPILDNLTEINEYNFLIHTQLLVTKKQYINFTGNRIPKSHDEISR